MARIIATSIYEPADVLTYHQLGTLAGIPPEVVRDKFGLKQKHVARPEEGTTDMAVRAAAPIVAQVGADRVRCVIYFGSPLREYPVWMASAKIQHELGCTNSYAFEVQNVSCGFPTALRVAKALVDSGEVENVLLAGGCVESRMIDYENQRSRFMFNFGDGGAACLVARDEAGPGAQILASSLHTDGSFWDFVKVPAGGTALPASHATVDARQHYIDVSDPAAMKERLDPVSQSLFARVAREAVARSGYRMEDVALLAPLHTKRSLFLGLLADLGLPEERAIYLDEWGHMSALDPLVGLHLAAAQGRLHPGDLCLALSAGTGYTWGATAIRWGQD